MDSTWAEQRRQNARLQADRLREREAAESAQAAEYLRRFISAARRTGLDPEPPKGFEATLQAALDRLCHWMEAPLDAYRRTYPVGISWHHGRRERLLGRTIVDVRAGDPPRLILDDGTEVAIDPEPAPFWEHGGI